MRKNITFLKTVLLAIILLVGNGMVWGATPYTMSSGNYSEDFADIANWTADFAAGTGASRWASVAINETGTLGDGVKTTVSTATFSTSTSGGVQKGSVNIYMLSTSITNSCAIDLFLDFTGRNAGTISFDVATVFNSTGNRDSKLKLFYSTDGTTFTEITGTNLPFTARNNVALSASITTIALPSAFNNSSTARLRFYEYSTALGGTSPTGSQPKISIDNISVTSTAASSVLDPGFFTSIVSSSSQINLSATANVAGNNIVVVSNGTGTFSKPTDGVAAGNAGDAFADGTIVYNGVAASITNHTSLTANTAYYYKAYSYDGSNVYSGGLTANATTYATEPTTQASALTFTNVTATGFTVNATAGNGTNRMYVIRQTGAVDFVPTDGTAYTANTVFTSGTGLGASTKNKVVAVSGTSVVVTGLTASTTYYVAVYELNGSSTTINYLTASPLTGNRITAPIVATAVTVGTRAATSMDLNWTSGNGNGRMVLARATTNPLIAPANGTTYTANSTDITDLLNGTSGSGNIIVYNGIGTSTTISGLLAGTQYQFYVYEYNGSGADIVYSAVASSSATYTLAAEPTVQASTVTFSSITATGMKINFTKGDGDNRIVLVKAESAVNSDPIDATSYTASLTFGSGEQIGTGNRVVYNGAGASCTITGLTANTTYYVAVYEFKGSGGNTNYLLTTPANGSQATLPSKTSIHVGDWTIPTNWDSGNVPGATDEVIINEDINVNSNIIVSRITINTGKSLSVNAGKQLTITGNLVNNGTLNLLSTTDGTATLTASSVSGSGTSNVSQYLSSARNWYISSPISGAAAPSGYTYYQRDEAGSSWTTQPFVGTTTFVQGKGYIALPSIAGSTLTFSGQLNMANVTVPLTWAGASSKGFNLIGNPYPSHLSWTTTFVNDVTNKATIEPTIWIRTNSGTSNSSGWSFLTYNGLSGEAVPSTSILTGGHIPPMQAFWVRALKSDNLVLDGKLTRSHQTSNALKAPAAKNSERQRLRLQIDNGNATDEHLMYFDINASNVYDRYDSPKMLNDQTTVPNIYSIVGSENLVINGMNMLDLDIDIPLGYSTQLTDSLSIRANEISNIGEGLKVILKDKHNSSTPEFELTNGTVYTFKPIIGTTNDRFSITFKSSSVINDLNKQLVDNFNISQNNSGQLILNFNETLNNNCSVNVYNTVGQLLITKSINSSSTPLDFNTTKGVYIFSILNGETKISKKFVIN